jgi:hypothetical protein
VKEKDDSLSTVGRFRLTGSADGSEGALPLELSSSLSLVIESGLHAEVELLHVLESDLCILSLTSGTKSLP